MKTATLFINTGVFDSPEFFDVGKYLNELLTMEM